MKILILFANILYAFFKLFPVKSNRVLFLSRQTNRRSLDFSLIRKELLRWNPEIRTVFICKRFTGKERSPLVLLSYGGTLLKICWHLARTNVVVLDSYSIPVSVLRHRKNLQVIQIWHAMGKIKKSGYAALGKAGGRSKREAKIFKMHKNYTAVITGGSAWDPYYCASFGVDEGILHNLGLPRADYLLRRKDAIREKVVEAYPELETKKLVLYAPTFRNGTFDGYQDLEEASDPSSCILVPRMHWKQASTNSGTDEESETDESDEAEFNEAAEDFESSESELSADTDSEEDKVPFSEFSTLELLAACDYLITDYSAIAVEAAVINKKTLYYCFDYDDYERDVGLNIDLRAEMPGCVFDNAHDLMNLIMSDSYSQESLDRYREKFLPEDLGNSASKIAGMILHNLFSLSPGPALINPSRLRRAKRDILKYVRLFMLYFSRIVFVRNKYKPSASFRQKIKANISGGFLADQWVLYDFDNNDHSKYLSEFDWYRSRYINAPYNFMLNNKVIADEILQHYIMVPQTIFVKSRGRLMDFGKGVKDTESLCDVLAELGALYCKPLSAGKGKGVYRLAFEDGCYYVDSDPYSREDFKQFLDERDNWFVTECAVQSKYLSDLYDKTTNTIRFIVFKDRETQEFQLFFAVQRIGVFASIPVDNGSRGGLTAKIDLETGMLSYGQTLHSFEQHKVHPDTGVPIEGVAIPNWDKIKEEMIELSNNFPWLNFIAWDILLTEEGICIIEANTSSGVNIVQLWGGQRYGALGDFYRSHAILKSDKEGEEGELDG